MTKEEIFKWLDRQVEINKEIKESPIKRLDLYKCDEVHIKDTLKMGEDIGVMTIVDDFGLKEYPYIAFFLYEGIKFYSLYKEGEIK